MSYTKQGLSIVIVNSLNDLPDPVAGTITLENKKRYIFNSQIVTPYNFEIPAGGTVSITSVNFTAEPLVYVGTGTLFFSSAPINILDLDNILVVFATGLGKLFDIQGADRRNNFLFCNKFICTGMEEIGTISNMFPIWYSTVLSDFGQGLILDTCSVIATTLNFAAPRDRTQDTSCTFDNTTDTILATAHEMYDNDLIRFTTDGTLPTGLRESITDINGAVIDNGDGTVRFTTSSAHGFTTGDTILIRDTTNYNATYIILATPTTTTFDVKAVYAAETISSGIGQQGYYVVTATTNDFQVSLTEAGSAVDFTTDGTGNHEFFENSVMLTMKGSEYTFNCTQLNMGNNGFPNVTAFDFEPTILASGITSRGNSFSSLSSNSNEAFAGSSLDQTYKYFKFTNGLGVPDSAVTGTLYWTGNTTVTALTINVDAPVAIAAPATFLSSNLERMEQIGNKLYYRGIDPIALKVSALITMVSSSALPKNIIMHIYKNGVDTTLAEPSVDILNRSVSLVDIEEIKLEENDYLEIWITNTSSSVDVIVSNGKLIV